MEWKPDWDQARGNLTKWWNRKGLALCLKARRQAPLLGAPDPRRPDDMLARWTDPQWRLDDAERTMAGTVFYAEAFPYFPAYLGPGSLGTMLGSEPEFSDDTAWYLPCIDDPDTYGPIRFEPEGNRWFDAHMALIESAVRRGKGKYLPGVPDLVEGLDTLAAMRGSERLLTDLMDRPEWVREKLAELNEAYFAVYDRIFDVIRDEHDGSAYCAYDLWGPGKTAKVQCDICCMISRPMFDEFVAGQLTAQCEWLDYSVYHLDGEDALPHLDSLLAIDALDAIEWTPIGASGMIDGYPSGGSPHWYDLYRRIRSAGKGVHAVSVKVNEVVPLLDAVGPEGVFVQVFAADEAEAEKLIDDVAPYRS